MKTRNQKTNWTSIIVLLSVFFCGCNPVEKPVSKLEQAREYLNQRDFDHASVLLRELVAEQPENTEFKLLFSSALAGSAGFDFTQSFPAFQESVKLGNLSKPDLNSSNTGVDSLPKIDSNDKSSLRTHLEKSLKGMTSETAKILEVFQFITYVEKGPKRDKLKEALVLLENVSEDDSLYPTSVGYSFLLNVVQTLNLLRDVFGEFTIKDGDNTRLKHDYELLCSVKYTEVVENSISSTYYMKNAIKNIDQLAVSRGRVATGIKKLVQSTNVFENIVQASKNDLKFIGEALEEIGKKNCS